MLSRIASTIGLFENRVYDGNPALLEALRASGRQLFVATSKPWCFTCRIVAHFGLDGFFGKVYGSELDGKRAENLRSSRMYCGSRTCVPTRP